MCDTQKKKKAFLLFHIFSCAGMLRKIPSFPQAVFLASFQAPIWYRNQIRNMSLPICNQLKTGTSLEPEDKGRTQWNLYIEKSESILYCIWAIKALFKPLAHKVSVNDYNVLHSVQAAVYSNSRQLFKLYLSQCRRSTHNSNRLESVSTVLVLLLLLPPNLQLIMPASDDIWLFLGKQW